MSSMTRKTGMPAQAVKASKSVAPRGEATPAALSQTPILTRDRIQARAYEIYIARNSNAGAGDPVSDWLQAERELTEAACEPLISGDIEVKMMARGESLLASGK